MNTKIAMLLAGLGLSLGVAGLAQAQSHSVTNYSNPPGNQADSKAATEATPGRTATADQQDAKHAGKGAKDAAANKGKTGKSAKAAKKSAAAAGGAGASSSDSSGAASGSSGSSGGGGASGAGNPAAAADQAASRDKSQSPTASVMLDGASKGGAEATMQTEPSESEVTPEQKAAFDVRGAGGSASSNTKK